MARGLKNIQRKCWRLFYKIYSEPTFCKKQRNQKSVIQRNSPTDMRSSVGLSASKRKSSNRIVSISSLWCRAYKLSITFFSFACTCWATSASFGFSTATIEAIGSTAATSTPPVVSCTITLHGNIVPILSSACKA